MTHRFLRRTHALDAFRSAIIDGPGRRLHPLGSGFNLLQSRRPVQLECRRYLRYCNRLHGCGWCGDHGFRGRRLRNFGCCRDVGGRNRHWSRRNRVCINGRRRSGGRRNGRAVLRLLVHDFRGGCSCCTGNHRQRIGLGHKGRARIPDTVATFTAALGLSVLRLGRGAISALGPFTALGSAAPATAAAAATFLACAVAFGRGRDGCCGGGLLIADHSLGL